MKQNYKAKQLKNRMRTVYDLICSKNYVPMRAKDIAVLLEIPKERRRELMQILDLLEADKKIEITRRGCYQRVHAKAQAPKPAKPENGEIMPAKKPRNVKPISDEPGADITSIVLAYGVPTEFPARVLAQADRCPDGPVVGDFNGRLDLRNEVLITIDGVDSKDLDDAVSLEREGSGWILGVHIADVSNYVQSNSALDREALKRGTSVYLADRVIPMLPKKLSNGVCSLNEGEDRLALSCIVHLDKNGKILKSRIAETVICVAHRMNYPDVEKILVDKDPELHARYADIVPMLSDMGELAAILRKNRSDRGMIDFDFPETKIILDAEGHPEKIYGAMPNTATRLIEQFMLTANEVVAKTYYDKHVPFLYRTHENPDEEKMESALSMIRSMGFPVEKKLHEISPKEVQKILKSIKGSPEEPMISTMILRSMKQARYSAECTGHFGLAAEYYCHFTSPIRRYPDLQIHRIIKDDLRGRLDGKRITTYAKNLDEVAWKTSALERRSVEVERETNKMKMAEYILNHIGEEWDAVITGVTEWGFYVQIPNTVEGLVHVMTLTDDFYEYDEETMSISGRRHGRSFRLGQKVRVCAVKADVGNRTIDFRLAEEET